MAKKTKAQELYEAIISFKPTETESAREEEYRQKISDLYGRLHSLEDEGTKLIRGLTAGEMATGNYRNHDRVLEIQQESEHIKNELKALTTNRPIFDDEFASLSDELEAKTDQRKELEQRYESAVKEYRKSEGIIPYSMHKQIEEEMYSLDAELKTVRKEEKDMQTAVNCYRRKTNVLFEEYRREKDAEAKAWARSKLQEIIDYLRACNEEEQTAERITWARMGKVVPTVPIAYGGSWLLSAIEKLTAILKQI